MRLTGKTLAMLAILGATSPAMAAKPTGSGTWAEVDAVSRTFDTLQFTRDRDGLAALVSPGLKYINGQGRMAGREAFLAAALEPVSTLEPFDIREREITLMGERAAAVTGFAVVRGSGVDHQRFEMAMRYLDLFAFIEGRWQVVLVQVTPAALPGSP